MAGKHIDTQRLEEVLNFYEQNSNHAYYLLTKRCADIQKAYDLMEKRYYNPFSSKKKYVFLPIRNAYVKWLFNHGFKKENKKHAQEIDDLSGVRKYYDTSLRKKIEQEENINEVNKKLKNLEEVISQTDDTISIYKSIIKRKVKDWKPGY